MDDAKFGGTRTELDSHANMAVIGKYVYVQNETGDTVEVNPFTPEYKAITARVVDAAIRYDCPYEGQSYILIIRNVIHVPSMENNLIPPFLLREAGIIVNDKAKIHVADPTVDNHAVVFPTTGFRIRLMLWGVFSFFSSWMPTEDDMRAGHDEYVLTPERWNPHTDAYARNEDNIVDWEGNVKEVKDRIMTLDLNQVNNDDLDHRRYSVSGVESKVNDCICAIRDDENNRCTSENSQMEWANNDAQMKEISSMYSVDELSTLLERKMNLGYDQLQLVQQQPVAMNQNHLCTVMVKRSQCLMMTYPWKILNNRSISTKHSRQEYVHPGKEGSMQSIWHRSGASVMMMPREQMRQHHSIASVR